MGAQTGAQQQQGAAGTAGSADAAGGSSADAPAVASEGIAAGAMRGPQAGSSAPSALPAHVATFAEDLSSYVRYDRFEEMASLQQGDARAASQQVCCGAAGI